MHRHGYAALISKQLLIGVKGIHLLSRLSDCHNLTYNPRDTLFIFFSFPFTLFRKF